MDNNGLSHTSWNVKANYRLIESVVYSIRIRPE